MSKVTSLIHRMFASEMLLLPFLVALGVVFYCLAAIIYYFDTDYTTHMR